MKLSRLGDYRRLNGLICATAAIITGIIYLHIGGAPLRYSIVNFIALAIGAFLLFLIDPLKWRRQISDGLVVFIGLTLIIVAIWGISMHGVHRWLAIGSFTSEPGLVLLPLAALLFARRQNVFSTGGIILLAVAACVQPDRSMAGALCAGLLAMLPVKRNGFIIAACCVAIVAFGITLYLPDSVPPVPFVEGVFISAFTLNPLLGTIIVITTALTLMPAVAGLIKWDEQKGVYISFIAIWLTLFIAAAIGNYPTPLAGYGCSAIIGYLLSVTCLPR
jgi:cell division protein FtsW (lipid II flippase)